MKLAHEDAAPSGSTGAGLAVSVSAVMRAGVVTCLPTTPLSHVAATMIEFDVESLVVVDDRMPTSTWGVLSVLDIVAAATVRALEEQVAAGSATMPAARISADETLRRAAELMTARRTAHLIVTDAHSGAPTGVLSALDVAAALAPTQPN